MDIANAIPIYIINQTIEDLLKLLDLLFFPNFVILITSPNMRVIINTQIK
jgi:putative effector of murein hydrolase LrgA (UPF0299 family)